MASSSPPLRREPWLDAARGTVLAVMLLTPAFGPATAQRWFRHSPWDGLTVSDLIFGSFLFLSGASLWFLLRKGISQIVVLRLVKRFLALMVLGLLYNAYPTGADLASLRFTGVLQTIAVSGALGAVAIWATSGRRSWLLVVAIAIIGLWTMAVARGCDPTCSAMFWLDTALIPKAHLYQQGQLGYDPEGIGPMLIGTALVILGWISMSLFSQQDEGGLEPWVLLIPLGAFAGAALALWLIAEPNKRLATGAYAFIIATVAYALMLGLRTADRRATGPIASRLVGGYEAAAAVLGVNALVVFIGERFINASLAATEVDGQPAWQWVAARLGASEAMSGVVVAIFVFLIIYLVTLVMKMLQWRVVL